MSKITDIKHRIDQMEGGEFQVLCDQYLRCRGYGTYYTPGQLPGTNKTTKGNPDTYFQGENQKLVFVMYTTQKDGFLSKAKEDILKCLDSSKTGVEPEDISEIVYCHTLGRLSAGNLKALGQFCKQQNVSLTLIGPHELGDDLYYKYPRLAKEFFGISIDSGQIMTLDEYIRIHDANQMSAPLGTNFLFRQEELQAAKQKLFTSDVLILSGKAGVGKTRLALELCKKVSEEYGYQTLCIKSNGLELAEELATTLEAGKEYLVLIDDANELSGLQFVLNYLPKVKLRMRSICKIVITVRDYAREKVVQQVLEVDRPEIQMVGILKDDELKNLVKTTYGILDPLCLEKILVIAEGNARLAMLAGKIAAESNCLESIEDASGLYDHYYGKQMNMVVEMETTLSSAGILAFFQTLRLDNPESIEHVLDLSGISAEEFKSDMRWLHNAELADLCHDTAVKISDQSLGNYLVKRVFVDKKLIPLRDMIKVCFEINRKQTVSVCNMLSHVFASDSVLNFLRNEICCLWDQIEAADSELSYPFLQAFGMIRPTKLLIILKRQIQSESGREADINTLRMVDTKKSESIDDRIIQLLCHFVDHSQLPEAVELLLQYYQKRPDLFAQVHRTLADVMGVRHDSDRYGYFTQRTIVDKLSALLHDVPTPENKLLFVRVAEQYLKFSSSYTEEGRKNTITFYTLPVTNDPKLMEIRGILLNGLHEIYAEGSLCREIESMLRSYGEGHNREVANEVIVQELNLIVNFLALFTPDRLYHCVIASHLSHLAEQSGFEFCEVFSPFLQSPKYLIYDAFQLSRKKLRGKSHSDRHTLHQQQVEQLVSSYGVEDYQFLFRVCKECAEEVDSELRIWGISRAIEYAILAQRDNPNLFVAIVREYLKADTPYVARPSLIVAVLFQLMPPESVESLLLGKNYTQQNTWMWEFFVEFPEEKLSNKWTNNLLLYLDKPNTELKHTPYRDFERLKKYQSVDPNIVLKASKIILSHYDESPSLFHLYFWCLIQESQENVNRIMVLYGQAIPLLEEIYLKAVSYSPNDDSDGILLAAIVKADNVFLYRYLDLAIADMSEPHYHHDEWMERLRFVWQSDDFLFYVDSIFDYWVQKNGDNIWLYGEAIGELLMTESGNELAYQKQEAWIQHTIECYSNDNLKMRYLFAAISRHGTERRRNATQCFLKNNSDYALFEKLQIEPSMESWSGSYVLVLQKKISYLESLLPMLSGIDYLEHRQYIQDKIDSRRAQIRQEEIREMMNSMF